MPKLLYAAGLMGLVAGPMAWAQDAARETDLTNFSVEIGGATVTITRDGADCPPSCIQPLQPVPGITTVAELEVVSFLESEAQAGRGLLVDLRSAESFGAMTLPGAVNVPAETLTPENPYRPDLLAALGLGSGSGGVFTLVLFGEDAAATAVVEAARDLIEAGYPADRLRYYRGGLASWTALGLSTAPGA